MPRRLVIALAAVAVLTGVAGCGRDVPPVPGTQSVASADRSEPLALSGPTLDGGTLDLADLRGQVVVLNNWASWCGPCRDETPALVDLAEGSEPGDVAVVGLNVTDDAAAAQAFVDEFGMPYPSIVDAEGDLLATIPGIPPSALPSTVILDREGRIAARIIGVTDPTELANLVAEIGQESATSS